MDNKQDRKRRRRGLIGPLILILIGIILLLERNGVIDRHALWQLLPLLPLLIGATLLAARLKRNGD